MAKIDKTTKVFLFMILAFAALIILTQSESKLDITLKSEGNILSEQSFKIPLSIQLSQSIFTSLNDFNFLLQSTEPIFEDNTVALLQAIVDNPFSESAQLLHVQVLKNNIDVGGKQLINKYMSSGESYIYKSEEISLLGNYAQRNNVQMIFVFENNDGERREQVYEYIYSLLTECDTNQDCSYPNLLCDLGNNARFSTSPNDYFCVKPCTTHGECYVGQVCLKGYCGY